MSRKIHIEKSRPLISVVMNCYNGEAYLKEALESIISQTYQNLEVIFWDNQSNDQTAKIFKSYSDPRLHYYYAPMHTKLGEARNLAFSKIKGDWVAFFDCDDLWLPDKLERQVDLIEDGDESLGLIYGQVLVVNTSQ